MHLKKLLYWTRLHKKVRYGVIAGAAFFGTFTTTAMASDYAVQAAENIDASMPAAEEESGEDAASEITADENTANEDTAPIEKKSDPQEADSGASGEVAETVETLIEGMVSVAESEPVTIEGTVEEEEIVEEPEEITAESYNYNDTSQMLYTTTDVNVRSGPSTDFDVIGGYSSGSEVEVTGQCVETGWYRIIYDGTVAYMTDKYTSTEKPEEETAAASSTWTGSVLTKSKGVNYGPSGKETYYNLDMSGVVSIMRGMGNNDEYWVRSDGCKMLGDYIMVAANLNVHPRGSLVETSLGTAIVCDTGGFASSNPTQLDIATNW